MDERARIRHAAVEEIVERYLDYIEAAERTCRCHCEEDEPNKADARSKEETVRGLIKRHVAANLDHDGCIKHPWVNTPLGPLRDLGGLVVDAIRGRL